MKIIKDNTKEWGGSQHTCGACKSVYLLDSPDDLYMKEIHTGRGERYDEIHHDCPCCGTTIMSGGVKGVPSWIRKQIREKHNAPQKGLPACYVCSKPIEGRAYGLRVILAEREALNNQALEVLDRLDERERTGHDTR